MQPISTWPYPTVNGSNAPAAIWASCSLSKNNAAAEYPTVVVVVEVDVVVVDEAGVAPGAAVDKAVGADEHAATTTARAPTCRTVRNVGMMPLTVAMLRRVHGYRNDRSTYLSSDRRVLLVCEL